MRGCFKLIQCFIQSAYVGGNIDFNLMKSGDYGDGEKEIAMRGRDARVLHKADAERERERGWSGLSSCVF